MSPLTYIIASRNDNFCGASHERLNKTLERISALHYGNVEVILVDWGSVQPLGLIFPFPGIRHIYVPQRITKGYNTPFNEVLALNIGIRRATTPWIARLDQDILVGEKFVKWFEMLNYAGPWETPAYFSERRDMEPDWWALRKRKGKRWSDWTPSYPYFYRAAVGILLAPRASWHQLRGYNESLIQRNHMEHDLCARFKKSCGLVNLGPLVDYDFYHQWHERIPNRKENPILSESDLENVSLQVNNENWGLGNVEL